MGKECGARVRRRLWGGSNTSPLNTTAWEARETQDLNLNLVPKLKYTLQFGVKFVIEICLAEIIIAPLHSFVSQK